MIARAVCWVVLVVCVGLMVVPALAQSEAVDPSPEPAESFAEPDHGTSEAVEEELEEPGAALPESAPGEAPADASVTGAPPAEDSAFDITLTGRKTWTIRYGFGHPMGLAAWGVSPGQLSLDQTLTADIVGEALSILTIEAHYNDQLSDMMQSIALYLDTERLDGVLGDFTFSALPGFAGYSKKMKGLQLEYLIGDAVVTAVVSKSEGIPERRIFVGQTAHGTSTFSARSDEDSAEPAPYRRNLDGLYAYALTSFYTPEFSSLHFQFMPSPSLSSVFSLYEVGFLTEAVALRPELEMKEQEFRVLNAEDQVLLLLQDPALLIRQRLRDLIAVYNAENGLVGTAAKKYPLTPGTEYELSFLGAVAASSQIVVDDVVYPLPSAQLRRFYNLGQSNVRSSSLLVEISADGVTFESVSDYRLSDFHVTLHEKAGILECEFPASFYTPSSVMRAEFDYTVSEGVFMLGLSLIPGSERVVLNSEPLRRDLDYMIDYEVGMLLVLVEMTDTDVLQVDYELYSGGLGTASDYSSYLFGLTFDVPVSDGLRIQGNVLQLADDPRSVRDADNVGTMPNRHTVVGVQADLALDDFSASVLVGYNEDRFPFDDNEKLREANRINAIADGDGYVLFGHQGGLTVNDGGSWETYGPESGLSSQVVQAIAFGSGAVYLGTNAGLTVVQLDGASPFDRIGNWRSYFEDDGLPDASVTALLVEGDTVWIGTRAGLVSMATEGALAELTLHEGMGFENLPAITALAADNDMLFIGTEDGAYAYDLVGDRFDLLEGTEGSLVYDLDIADETLYVASNRGVRSFRHGVGTGWLVLGQPVYAVLHSADVLYCGLASGLMTLAGETSMVLSGWTISDLWQADSGVWVGVRASETHEINVWLLGSRTRKYAESVTGITGHDPYGFIDSPASEHTVTGWVGRGSFSKAGDDYTLSGIVELQPPSFRPIGSRGRADSTGWNLSGNVTLGRQGSLRADHEYRMTDQLGEMPSARMANGMTLSWSFTEGPQFGTTIRQVSTHETDAQGTEAVDEMSTSFFLSQSFFRNALSLRMSWDRSDSASDRWGDQWERQGISLSFNWKLSSNLSTKGLWSRPIRRVGDDVSGRESLDWNWDWNTSLGFAKMDVAYSADWTRTLFDEQGDWVHDGSIRLDVGSLQFGGWDVKPNVKFNGSHERSDTDLHGEAVLGSKIDNLTFTATVRGHLTELGRPVFNRKGELALSARYSASKELDASLSYNASRSEAVKGDQRAPSSSDSVVGRLVWSPVDGPRDELSFSWRLSETETTRQLTAMLENSLTLDLQGILTQWMAADDESESEALSLHAADLRVDSKAEYRSGAAGDPEFSFSTTVNGSVAVSPKWNVALVGTYAMGRKTTVGIYHSVLFELTFAIDF